MQVEQIAEKDREEGGENQSEPEGQVQVQTG